NLISQIHAQKDNYFSKNPSAKARERGWFQPEPFCAFCAFSWLTFFCAPVCGYTFLQMQSIFGPDGLIAKAHPEYEHRPGQIDMAEAVLRAFEQKRHLIVEAGTGTGKTLAYLVPAIAAACGSGARVVISTGTKNLQEQLMDKDIPFLQEVLPTKFRAALMKGRNNYACLHRI